MNDRIHTAFRRYQFMAWTVGTVLLLMTLSLIRFGWSYDATWFHYGWQLHGFLFMVYLLATADLGVKARWPIGKLIVTALWGTVPGMSFVAERRLRPQYQ